MRYYACVAGHPIAREFMPKLAAWYASRGDQLVISEERSLQKLKQFGGLVCWSGRGPTYAEISGYRGPRLWLEVGWLSQSRTLFANHFGTTGLAKWPHFSPRIAGDYAQWKQTYLASTEKLVCSGNLMADGQDPCPKTPYVLVVGQLERDASMFGAPLTSPLALCEAALVGTPAIGLGYNVWSDLPWPYTIPRAVPGDLAYWLSAGPWAGWQPDVCCDFLRRQQVDRYEPVFNDRWIPIIPPEG